MPLAILTYHSMRVHGSSAQDNDLIAFSEDTAAVHELGWRIVPLRAAIDRWLADPGALEHERWVAMTCDDGSDFDFRDLVHPTWGPQRSLLNRARDASAAGIPCHLTSFAIVSPAARAALDASCMIGAGWWNDAWWPEAIASGLMHVASHSWDHNHDFLPEALSQPVERGTFHSIATQALADIEIGEAQRYLQRMAPNPGTGLFAYPYGHANRFLVEEYLPRHGEALGLVAAFGDSARAVTRHENRWNLPRFVRGPHWNDRAQLARLLRECEREAA